MAETPPHNRLERGHVFRRVRWFAAEFFVVVSGILAALAVDAWWSDRTERAQEYQLLIGLRTEFLANRGLFLRTIDMHRETIEQARQLVAMTGPDTREVDEGVVDELLFPLMSVMPTYHPAMGEVEAMLGSGQLGLIQNDDLRTAVAAWPGTLALLRETEDEMREDVIQGFYPYLVDKVPLMTMDFNVGFIDSPSRFPRDYQSLLSDVEFENHVENRWVMAEMILADARPVGELLDQVIFLLQNELGDDVESAAGLDASARSH